MEVMEVPRSNQTTYWVFPEKRRSGPQWSVKWNEGNRAIKRQVGAAWLTGSDSPDAKPRGKQYGSWIERRGRPQDGFLSYTDALTRAAALIDQHRDSAKEAVRQAVEAAEQAARPSTFRELAHDWLGWLEHSKGSKPSTLAGYGQMLTEPGVAHKRGKGESPGYIMKALGDLAASDITTAHVDGLLETIKATGATPRTVNAHRAVVRTIFNFGIRQTEAAHTAGGGRAASPLGHDYGLVVNPAKSSTAAREDGLAPLTYYRPEEVEALARALASGAHRKAERSVVSADEQARLAAEDAQDGEAVRVAAYAGLRLGELLELRWRDIDWSGFAITVSRAISAGAITTPKSGRIRRVPMPDQAAGALERLSRRADFTGADELVFCNQVTGRHLNGSALRRRYKSAQTATGLAPLRWHDLRHTYGSLLAANPKVELLTIKAAMGHQNISTTERYLHARPATELAATFTEAFRVATASAVARQDSDPDVAPAVSEAPRL